ncbi:MAG: XRE family transcriptional regulator [Clostridiales bacterium]|nr:XRE family transcriptional regulator [Clostridiales bacterium]
MNIEQEIKILCVKNDMSLAQLAKRLNMTPQAFNQKLKRGTFSLDDLKSIAMVSNCMLECAFVFANGDRIEL